MSANTFCKKNVDIRNTVVANLEASNPWASKTAKSCHMLLASSFCSPRKVYEERTSSPEHQTRLSLSTQSVASGSDSDESLFKHPVVPTAYRYTSRPPAVGACQNDAICGDTNRSLDSLLLTDRAIARANNIESSSFDFKLSQMCMDRTISLICDRVDVESLKTDETSGNFDCSHFGHDVSASGLTGTSSSKSDLSSHSVSTQHTSQSDRYISAAKHPCSASTQTNSSELLLLPIIYPPAVDDNLSSSSSATPSVVEPTGAEVTHTEIESPRQYPLTLLFSTVSSPSSTYSVRPPAQNTSASLHRDYQLMNNTQLSSAGLGGGLPSGDHSSSVKLTKTRSTSAGSALSSVNPAHMENCKLLHNQFYMSSHGQKSMPPVLTVQPSNPLSSTFNHSDLPTLQFASSTKSASSPRRSQLKYAPYSSSSPLAYEQNQHPPARSFPQYASSPIQDSQHTQTLPQSRLQSPRAPVPPSSIPPSFAENRNCTALQYGFSARSKEPNFHPVHRQSLSASYASTSAGIDQQPQAPVTHASPSQILTTALKSFDQEDHRKNARFKSGHSRMNMNLAKVAVETVCRMPSNPQKEQTVERDAPLTSPAHNKDSSSVASSSSSHDEFLSPPSSILDGSDHSSQTHLLKGDDDDDAESTTSSWSTHCSIKNLS